jgi:hypothetical protein
VSYSWVDPHFSALYARREEQRLTEKLLDEARARQARLPELDGGGEIVWRRSSWLETSFHGSRTFRLI